jgi:serine/threonine-protein kinase
MRTPCPAPEQWQQLVAGQLPEDQGETLAQHLPDCDRCRQTVEELARADAGPLPTGGEHRDSGWRRVVGALGAMPPPEPAEEGAAAVLRQLAPPGGAGHLGRLGRYEVQRVLGQGGFGVVLRAHDPDLQRAVAIKVLAPHLAASDLARQRFTREARASAALRDDHIVAIHDVGSFQEGWPYFVMEYVEGQSLQEKLRRGAPLPLVEVLRIGMQIAASPAAAHKQGLVHRDIKPGNILLENGVERVKITDFGLVQAAGDTSRLTQTGAVAGTPEYMAPEQAEGKQVDHRADLFSLGSVLYVLCTGRSPFRASTPLATLRRVCEESPPPARSLNPAVPDWLEAIIGKLHAKAPADRFQSAAEVADLLGQWLQHLQQGGSATSPAPTPPAGTTPKENDVDPKQAEQLQRQNRRLKVLLAAGGLLLLLVIVAAGLAVGLMNRGNPSGNPAVAGGPGTHPTENPGNNPPGNGQPVNPEGKQPGKEEANPPTPSVKREDLYGKWKDEQLNYSYEFEPSGQFSFWPGDKPLGGEEIAPGFKVPSNKQPGTYTLTDGRLKMTFNSAVMLPIEGNLTWQQRPNLLLLDKGLAFGKSFWKRVP